MPPDMDIDLGDGLRVRPLYADDAALLAEATSTETAPALWGPRPAGKYSLADAQAALSDWDPAAGGQFSTGILAASEAIPGGRRLLGAVGLMPDSAGTIELAYWVRPEYRGRRLAPRAVRAVTMWAYQTLDDPRLWLEIRPGNEASLRVAERAGYTFGQRLPRHCRDWSAEDADRDTWHDCLIWTYRDPEQLPLTER